MNRMQAETDSRLAQIIYLLHCLSHPLAATAIHLEIKKQNAIVVLFYKFLCRRKKGGGSWGMTREHRLSERADRWQTVQQVEREVVVAGQREQEHTETSERHANVCPFGHVSSVLHIKSLLFCNSHRKDTNPFASRYFKQIVFPLPPWWWEKPNHVRLTDTH